MSNIDAALTPASNGKIPVTKLREALATAKTEITALESSLSSAQQTIASQATALAQKQNAVGGKGLSSNDYTNEEKTKLENLQQTSGNFVTLPTITLSANTTIIGNPATPVADTYYLYQFVQGGSGGYSVTLHGETITGAALGSKMFMQYYCDGTDFIKLVGTVKAPAAQGGIGDSQSLNSWSTPAIVTSTTTETVSINDGAEGSAYIIAATTPNYVKTVAQKVGSAKSDIYADGRLGFARLNGNANALRIGAATPITLPRRHTIGVLARLPNSAITGYNGRHLLLSSAQNGGSGQPLYSLGIAGASIGDGNKASRIGVEFETNNNTRGFCYSAGADSGYVTSAELFGATAVKQDSDWFWSFIVGGSTQDTQLVGDNIVASGSSLTYANKLLVGKAIHKFSPTNIRAQHTNHTYAGTAEFIGSIVGGSNGTLNVTSMVSGTIEIGAVVSSGSDHYIFAQTGGTPGGVGDYTVRRGLGGSVPTVASTTMTSGGLTETNYQNLQFIIRPGTGSAAVMDVARVMIIEDRLSIAELDAITKGAHPKIFGVPYQLYDLSGLIANVSVEAGAPTFITDATSPVGQVYLGDNNTTQRIINITNGRAA